MGRFSKRVIALVILLLSNNAVFGEAKYFKDTFLGKRDDGCYLLSRGPGTNIPKNLGLQFFSTQIIKDLENKNWRKFYKHFHPRARVAKDIGNRIEAILEHRYEKPWQFSVFGIWAFVSKNKEKDLYRCEKADHMQLVSHSGYEKQYMLVVQMMGQNELGRLVFSIAPKPDKNLTIVGFHIQQWSHLGQNWQSWTEKGNAFLKNGDSKSAYIHYDIAQKLLDGGKFIIYDIKKNIYEEREKIFTQEKIVQSVQADSENTDIVYVGTILSRTDTGMLLRVEIEKEYNAEDLQNKCTKIGKSLLKNNWLEGVNGGVNCNFIPKGANPKINSKIGGYYIPRSKLI